MSCCLPLTDLRVVDLSRYLPGPCLTRILADLGADVAIVESPHGGDPLRYVPPHVDRCSSAFASLNYAKRSLALDLKHPLGLQILDDLSAKADVLVESFRPGVLERLGMDFNRLAERNPRLVVCRISGYGQTGALRDQPAHDLGIMARSGVLSLFGPRYGPPALPGIPIADMASGGLGGAVQVLAALLERERTGRGRILDVSLTRGTLALARVEAARLGAGGQEERGYGLLTGGRPCYRLYETRDKRWMALAALEPKFFAAFCARAGCRELEGQGWASGAEGERVMAKLEELFASREQAEWVALLEGTPCCCEPVQSLDEALADPGVAVSLRNVAGVPVLAPESREIGLAVPSLGAHSFEVVRDYGVDQGLVARAKAAGALGVGEQEP